MFRTLLLTPRYALGYVCLAIAFAAAWLGYTFNFFGAYLLDLEDFWAETKTQLDEAAEAVKKKMDTFG